MRYEVWNDETGNRIQRFSEERLALAFIQRNIEAYGTDFVSAWSLIQVESDGEIGEIAVGDELAAIVGGHSTS